MAEGTRLEIVSPERLVISQTVRSVTIPGSEGYFTVVGDHAPLVTTLKPGFVTAIDEAGTQHTIFVRGGFADVSAEGVTLLADEARREFTRAEFELVITDKQMSLDAATTLEARMAAQNELDEWRNLLLDAGVAGAAGH